MIGLTDIQQQIRTSLIVAIHNNRLQMVQRIFDSNENDDIQAALSHEGTLISDKGTILDFVIGRPELALTLKKKM